MNKNPRLIDLSGLKFGKWRVIEKAGNTKRGAALWLCQCACGSTQSVTGGDLRAGKSTMCKPCRGKKNFTTHNQTGTRLHRIWKAMRTRCNNPNAAGYKNYGGKGVSVCPEWSKFSEFADWAGANGYRDTLSIDRVDGNGNYEPSNCRWADKKTQSSNRDYTKKNKDGVLWWHIAQLNGITRAAFASRIYDGWDIEKAATISMTDARKNAPRTRDKKTGRFI